MAVSSWEASGARLRAAHHAVAEEESADHGRGRVHGRHRGRGKQSTLSKERQQALQQVSNSLGEVIEVLSTMLTEFSEQELEDKNNWEKYSKWSDGSETEKNNFISEQEALVMAKSAQENANKQMVQQLTENIGQLTTDISDTEASIAELVKMRKEERKQFEEGMVDITKTIKAVTKATEILESHYAASGAELDQIRSRVQLALATYGFHIHSATQDKMDTLFSLLQDGSGAASQGPDFLNTDGSKYDSYQKQGGAGGVIGMLTDLRDQLENQRQSMVAKETESNTQFQQTKAAKESDLAHMKKTKSDKETQKTECEAIIQECQSTIAQAQKEISDAKAYVVVLLGDRAKFQKAYNERVTMRKAEQSATQAALDALQAVSAGAKEAVEGRSPGAASLLQVSRKAHEMRRTSRVAVSAKVVKKISHQLAKMMALGKELRSESLVKMAQKLKDDYMTSDQASFYDAGAFGPVMKLLSDLIARLEEEASAETSQHEWCEAEKNSGKEGQAAREKSLRTLQASVESFTTQIAQLKTEVLALEAEIARVQEETRIAKEIRAQEHAVFVQAKKDHDEVIGAIQVALQALGGQYSLVEINVKHNHRRQPFEAGGSMPFQEYSSGSGGAASAMEMLEDLEGRYSAALSEIVSDENNAQKMHEELLARNAQFIAETTNTRNAKVSERRAAIVELADDKSEVKTNLLELHQISKYLQDLRPSCDDIRSTYEERKRRREAEIAALKEALEVLSDPSSMS
jgi:hypothetical protein